MNEKICPCFDSLADSLVSLFGTSVSVSHSERVSGGDINRAYVLTLNDGSRVFMKANEKKNSASLRKRHTAFTQLPGQVR